ncbi:50S ribosomal protein L3 [Leuconostoc mesenteroides]|uniref:50S ribosomal protein L3 n=1 Tax=Leuconostoc mesenteroides TaxID=1245 RepID=UPI00235F5B29|nr:50S ribosomal protein L3 [Leuconostoc mesenteroides]
MTKGILGRKVGMTQVFTESGELIAVTAVEATPNVVLQVKNAETDGYSAIQLGYQDKRTVLSSKPEQGHASKANTAPKRYVREIRNAGDEFNVGDEIKVDTFQAGEYVDVTGITKGHGFQGAIKRLGQSRGPMTHGSRYHRRPGSMGAIINRVFKGKLLPGRMGNNKRTMQNIAIVHVDVENNLLLLKGNVPGANKSLLTVKSTVKVNAKHPEVKMANASASATNSEEA